MFTHIKMYFTTLPNNTNCYSSQARKVAQGFLGTGGAITSLEKGGNSQKKTVTHWFWLPEGTDATALATQHPIIYLEMQDGNPTGKYLNQTEYASLTVQPAQQVPQESSDAPQQQAI